MINYLNLAKSIDFYEEHGFKRIEAPWLVPPCIDSITKPKNKRHYMLQHNDKCLVASGEQSFLYLYLKENLPLGKFQTITPCFRDDRYDLYHEKYFMKNELINTENVDKFHLEEMIETAMNFYRTIVPNRENLEVRETEIGFDIEYFDKKDFAVELGSYGIRECEFLKWIYGTGCAEPRLSKVCEYK